MDGSAAPSGRRSDIDGADGLPIHDELTPELAGHAGAEAFRAEGARMERRDLMNLLKQLEGRPG